MRSTHIFGVTSFVDVNHICKITSQQHLDRCLTKQQHQSLARLTHKMNLLRPPASLQPLSLKAANPKGPQIWGKLVPLAPDQKCELQGHSPHALCGVSSHWALLRPVTFPRGGSGREYQAHFIDEETKTWSPVMLQRCWLGSGTRSLDSSSPSGHMQISPYNVGQARWTVDGPHACAQWLGPREKEDSSGRLICHKAMNLANFLSSLGHGFLPVMIFKIFSCSVQKTKNYEQMTLKGCLFHSVHEYLLRPYCVPANMWSQRWFLQREQRP